MLRQLTASLLTVSLLAATLPSQALAAAFEAAPTAKIPVLALPALPSSAVSLPASSLPALPAPSIAPLSAKVPAVQARLAASAQAAAKAAAHPSGAEADSRRVDFTQAPRPASDSEAVPETAPSEQPAALAPNASDGAPSAPTPPAPRGMRAYLGSVFAGQLSNNALIVTLPLIVLQMTHSLASLGFVTAVTSGLDMAGTLLGGWLEKPLGPRALLTASSVLRTAAIAAIPFALAGGAGLSTVVLLFSLDALGRGINDTARNTVPLLLAGREKSALDRLNSRYQTSFEFGGVAGPLLTAALFAGKGHPIAALASSAIGFAVSALGYLWLPKKPVPQQAAPAQTQTPAKKTSPFKDPFIRLGLATTLVLSLAPALRSLLPAIMATSFLHSAAATSWLTLAFGVGSTGGAWLYERLSAKKSIAGWIHLASLGVVAAAAAWIPGSFWLMAAGFAVFAGLNALGKLALTTGIQERIPEGSEGPVMGVQRFAANKAGMLLRGLIGLAFAGGSPLRGMIVISAGLILLALGQFWMGGKLGALALAGAVAATPAKGPKVSPVHGYPGRIIAVEGLDGSGKSTQMELLKQRLESQGQQVVVTTWNSSDFVSEAVKKAKKAQALSPKSFALLNAADFQERLENVIIPALKEGKVVLADRWFFTALARDSVRGNDPRWLRGLYKDAPRPDLTLYFKLPVDTAIGRVLQRSGKPSLSEDFEDAGETQAKPSGPKYYEAGLDLHLSDDPVENFRLFQSRVTASYDAQVREFGLKPIDASRSREEVSSAVEAAAGPLLAQLAPAEAKAVEKANIFDKDPAKDPEDLRRNYLKDKKGVHFYFRNMLERMQERFAQLVDHREQPKVFLHGSGHVDNYAKSAQGAAMIDFDRSRVGPYSWDLVRTLVSVSLRRKKQDKQLLDPAVSREFLRGYLRGLRHPEQPFSEMHKLKNVEPQDGEQSVSAYLKADKKWAKEMRKNPLAADDAQVQSLVSQWAAGRKDGLLNDYYVKEAGRGHGSMGQRGIFLVVLAPKEKHSGKDKIFLSIKQARTDPDTEWYKNPFSTQAERMIAASELYAPGWDQYQGGAWLDGVEYHVRAIPPLNAKIKKMLDDEEQKDFLYAVGTQFGRAHRLSVQGDPAELEKAVKAQYGEIVKAGLVIRDEIVAAHRRYLKDMGKRGLTPSDDGSSEE